MRFTGFALAAGLLAAGASSPASAASFFFSTGSPDGKLAAATRPSGPGTETETGDDFVLTEATKLTSATFTGLVPDGTKLTDVTNVIVEIYRVFPQDSVEPPSG